MVVTGNNRKSRVSIVSSGYLPVPDVLGGAVEALITMLLRENEITPSFNFTVYSSYSSDALSTANKFKHAEFVFIKIPRIIKIIDFCIYFLAKHVLQKRKLMSYRFIAQRLWYIRKVAQKLSQTDSDALILENHPTLFSVFKMYGNSQKYSGKVYYHLHNEVTNTFGCTEQIRTVHKVLGVSNYIVTSLDSRLGGLKSTQKAVWRNCVDTKKFNPNNAETQKSGKKWREKLEIGENELVILFSGRLTEEKGARPLLEAFIQANIPNARLVIAGAFFVNTDIVSPFEQSLRTLAKKAGDRIIFTGFVNHDQMPGIYAMADLCCLPSLWDDPAPLSVIECLASGRVLVTTNSGGIPEYASKDSAIILERDAELVPNLIKTLNLLGSDQRSRIVKSTKARKAAEAYSESAFLNQLKTLL
ncbi:glycosyltransferase family 4 protein [Bifidobacterium aquikefiri]|uniref:glycosyltransferase family 4 protein n=1 Tax=Bifidobacterium aquikefiri TaxID=1653207 RepID=UPI0039E7BF93